ncbi:Rieske 2Fe-2S domain-containing protein [Bradyrhizobium huanghuaihaiense]|uniref:Rieske 2Fe-2S domain-containing protein n=1 Tax=Bradyrhizobium huanghuaihaiense TaxID=990078 RepID=UPI0021AA14DE|nr:Rieske 2Fe-2S domain-containing protein [Bradyrhizobium sp. CB3035]UWU81504.1 Rieske 2Fe-2S domain-containing protein [Bradyrhizobium sp. CB3035]
MGRSQSAQFVAAHDVCTHAFSISTDGWLEENILECLLHAGQFDLKTGLALGDPVTCDLNVLDTRICGGRLEVLLPQYVNPTIGM